MQWSEPSCYMVWKRFILQKPCWTKSTHSRSEDWGKSSTSRLLLLTGGSQTDMFCEEHPISCPLMEIMKPTTSLLFSHYYNERRAKLLGHIARTTQQDPLRQISFQPNSVNRVPYGKKRHGRPRQNWLHYTKKYIYEDKLHQFNYEETVQEDARIFNAANARYF